jgi:hypothetical protein
VKEITVRGVRYQIGVLPARTQWNVLRRVAPVLKGAVPAIRDALTGAGPTVTAPADGEAPSPHENGATGPSGRLVDVALTCLAPLTDAISELSDADSDYVINVCLAVVRRWTEPGGWKPMTMGGAFMFAADDNLMTMIAVTGHVLMENLGGFLVELPGQLSDAPPKP